MYDVSVLPLNVKIPLDVGPFVTETDAGSM